MSVATDLAAKWGLKAAWNLSGLTDSFGANTLTNNNAATFGAGKLGNAVALASASSQSLSIADNAALSGATNIPRWLTAWAKFTTIGAGNQFIAGKHLASAGERSYRLQLNGAAARLEWSGSVTGATTVTVQASTFGAITTATWYFVMGYYDPVTDLLGISVNGGAWDTTALVDGLRDNTVPFTIGALGSLAADFLNGQVDAVKTGVPPLLGMTALRDEIRDFEWNGGAGREYPTDWVVADAPGTAVAALSEVYSATSALEAIGSATATLEAIGSATATLEYANP